MPAAALYVCHSQREGAHRGPGIVVLPRECQGRLAILGHAGCEREPHRGARWKPDSLTKADDRVEDDTGCSRERASVERLRVVGISAAAKKPGAIRLPFKGALGTALQAQGMKGPRRRIFRIPETSMTQ